VSNATNITQKHPLSLESYVETTKLIALDPWQVDICRRLERAFWLAQFDKFEKDFTVIDFLGTPYQLSPSGLKINQSEIDQRHDMGTRAAIHAPPQFGKSIIISQCYPAWILGWDPLHRFRLATYNMLHSARFSVVVKHLMQSAEHQALFPDPAGHLPVRSKVVEWSTNARLAHPDGQASFTALGLQSGFVGTGYDTLLMDDPYKSAEEALSEVIRDKTWRFWTDTASTRAKENSNVFIMFHRYHQDDMGGRAIGSGEFELWRYAAEPDGDYEDEESGLNFLDPMGREVGQFLSSRFGELFYTRQKRNEQVWYSQFQGRPSAKTGKMFNVGLFKELRPQDVPQILHWVRAWDNAATEGAGAYTAGPLMGVDAAENIYVCDMERKQVGTAERQLLQETTAERDGKLVQIHVPQDPGSAGKDVAFEFQQHMSQKGYLVTAEKVSGSKEMRAYPYSKAVNLGKVFLVLNEDGSVPAWHKKYKSEFRYFPSSTFKDQVDSSSDGYSHLMRLFYRGLVIKNVSTVNLLHRSLFANRFGSSQIPQHWEVAAAVRIAPDSSKPSGYCITARAAENAHIGEAVFIVAAARMYVNNPIQVLDALCLDLIKHCAKGVRHPDVVWLNRGAGDVLQVTAQKMDMRLTEFRDDATAGIPETNYYFQKIPGYSHFYNREGTTRCHVLVDDDQFEIPNIRDEGGMLSLRQDLQTWSYNGQGRSAARCGHNS
jgi:predicted phage terminase large subunit-like protein